MGLIDPQLPAILACPVCKEKLLLVEQETTLLCDRCERSYLINADGVPIMTVVDD